MQIRFVSLKIDLSIEEASSVIFGFKLIVGVAAAPDQSWTHYKGVIHSNKLLISLLANILR